MTEDLTSWVEAKTDDPEVQEALRELFQAAADVADALNHMNDGAQAQALRDDFNAMVDELLL